MLLVVILLLLTLLQVPLSTTFSFEQFKDAIKYHKEFFGSCPGSVIIIDEIFDTNYYQEFINEFVQIYTFPIVIIGKNDVSVNTSLEMYKNEYQPEFVCHHLIRFTSNLPNNLTQLYKELDEYFFVKYSFIIVLNSSHIEMKNVGKVLNDMQREEILIITLEMFNIFQWRIDGQIHQTNTLQEPIKYLTSRNVNNLMGRKLLVGTLHFPPAAFVGSDPITNSTIVDGIEANLIRLLASKLNFTIEFQLNKDPEQMWEGLRGMLQRQELDIAFGELYILDDKWKNHISFTEAFKTNHECFLVPSPKPYAKWMAVIFPLSVSTWIATVFSVIFSVLTLRFVAKWSTNNIDTYFSDAFICILYVLGNLLTVQQPREIYSGPNRVFMVAWLFVATIISSAYRSGLISFLTQPSSPAPIQTIEQLVKSPFNKIMYDDYYPDILKNSSDSYRRLLGQQLIATYNISYMFSLLDTGVWAVDSTIDRLLYEADLRYPINKKENPPFHLMKECMLPTRSSFGLPKNSPLKPYLDKMIVRFVETGLVKYHRSQFVKKMRGFQGTVSTSKELVPFTLNNLQGAFYLFTCGVALSCLIFLLEICVALVHEIIYSWSD